MDILIQIVLYVSIAVGAISMAWAFLTLRGYEINKKEHLELNAYPFEVIPSRWQMAKGYLLFINKEITENADDKKLYNNLIKIRNSYEKILPVIQEKIKAKEVIDFNALRAFNGKFKTE